jgi:hypothetical protein
MKKTLYYSDRVKLEKIFLGIIWLISGILGFFDGILSLVMQIAASITCIYALIKISISKKENADEMAEQNMNRAKALALDYMQIVYCCLAIIAIIFLRNVELSIGLNKIIPNITFIAMGINQLFVGFAFRKFEEE